MRITSKGQVTIPADIREQAGFLPHTEVDFLFDGSTVRLIRGDSPSGKGRGQRLVEHLRNQGRITMSTDEIMALTREP
ncbi:MAG: AbrB/MazE/SpoVT family DNA-binding domain-containing protein [Magnetococcus sp. THC-1_WYH]